MTNYLLGKKYKWKKKKKISPFSQNLAEKGKSKTESVQASW